MVHRRARVHSDEDSVGQVGEDDGESSRRSVRRARTNDSKASRLGGRSDTRRHRRFDRFDLKTCHTLKFLEFQDVIKIKINQCFSRNFKIFPTFIFFTGNLV